jgi:hypothetical protein
MIFSIIKWLQVINKGQKKDKSKKKKRKLKEKVRKIKVLLPVVSPLG